MKDVPLASTAEYGFLGNRDIWLQVATVRGDSSQKMHSVQSTSLAYIMTSLRSGVLIIVQMAYHVPLTALASCKVLN
jgi:hypothetical protein